MKTAWIPTFLGLMAAAAAAGAPARPDPESLRAGLLAPGRDVRERAREQARVWARTDPVGVAALREGLDERGRCLLIEALASAGTSHAATVAARLAAGAEEEIFRSFLDGLVRGGTTAMLAVDPASLPAARGDAVRRLQLRWRAEEQLSKLKSTSGRTGHYQGQFEGLQALGRGVIPLLFDILTDHAHALPGESASGPFRPIHPWMVRFEHDELRGLAAYAFGEIASPEDRETLDRLESIFERYEMLNPNEFPVEYEDLRFGIAFSLYDLGRPAKAEEMVRELERIASSRYVTYEVLAAWWDLGYALIRMGRPDEGEGWYERLVLYGEAGNRAIAAYNLACNFAVRAEREPRYRRTFRSRALHWLKEAIHTYSYADWQWMEEDGDLDSIRDDPAYNALLAYLQRKYPGRPKGSIPKELEDFLRGRPQAPEAEDAEAPAERER